MRKIFSNKQLAAVAVAAVAVTGTGVAYAYWTSTGSGSGSATAGDLNEDGTDAIVLSPVGDTEGMYPGGPAVSISVKAVNPADFDQRVGELTITPTYPAGCDNEGDLPNWALVDAPDSFGDILQESNAGTTDEATEVVGSIQLLETGLNQDDCKSAPVTFAFATAPNA